MKLKNILACALGAGLLTFAGGSAQAALNKKTSVIDGFLVIPLNPQLIIKYTDGNGKVQRATINTKALVAAISLDFGENFSGDRIVYWYEDGDFHLMDKQNNLVNDVNDEDLSEDGVIVADVTRDSSSTHDGSNGRFTYVETGTDDFEFYSDGDQVTLGNDTLEFIDDTVPYTYTETAGPIKNGEQQVNITEKADLGATGHDFTVVDIDPLPIFGSATQNGGGKVPTANVP
jgi:hypothetical protein